MFPKASCILEFWLDMLMCRRPTLCHPPQVQCHCSPKMSESEPAGEIKAEVWRAQVMNKLDRRLPVGRWLVSVNSLIRSRLFRKPAGHSYEMQVWRMFENWETIVFGYTVKHKHIFCYTMHIHRDHMYFAFSGRNISLFLSLSVSLSPSLSISLWYGCGAAL